MVDERTAYWGARDDARYRTRDDDPTGGDYVVAETLDANGDPVEVLLRWDDTAGEWVSGGPVNMNGEDVTNVGALDADSVNTEILNNILLAESGELQDKLSAASPDEEVWAVGGAHDPGSETTVPQDVTLRWVGAHFEPTTDYNGFYLEGGAELLNCHADLAKIGSSYTSKVVTVDSGRFGTAYRQDGETEVRVELRAEQAIDAGTGTALHLRSTASGSIGVGCEFELAATDFNVNLDLDTDGAFIQGGTADVFLKAGSTADIRHQGSGPAGLLIRGVIQANSQSDVGIKNTTATENSVNFIGQWFDVVGYATAAIEGNSVTVRLFSSSQASDFIGQTIGGGSSGFGTSVQSAGPVQRYQYYHAQEDEAFQMEVDNGQFLWSYDSGSGFTATFAIQPDGDIISIGDGGGLTVTSPDGSTTAEIGIDNSGNVVSR